MSDDIQVLVRGENNATVIDLIGDVTTFAEESINQAYQSASDDGATNIIFNFRENDLSDGGLNPICRSLSFC
jgi:hypothetical protein